MTSIIHSGTLWTFILFGSVFIAAAFGWGSNDKIRLSDVNVVTLHPGKMTNYRRTHPVPQLKCVGGTAGCSAFTPSVVQCYNRGSDGYDVQWECKTDMSSRYKFGEIAVSCEGYDYPDDPYVLKGSCGLEYTIDAVDRGGHYDDSYHSGYRDSGHRDSYRNHYTRNSGSWLGSIIMFGIIALVAYYIYQRLTHDPSQHNNSSGGYTQSSGPPPPGFRPEYVPGDRATHSSSHTADAGTGAGAGAGTGFWSGAATGGLLGYLFGGSGSRSAYYNNHGYYGPRHHQRGPGYGNGGSNWFGSNNSWSSGWTSGSSFRGNPSSPSTRTTSGFGGTKRR
ncbi:Store-operated calcium entry-associated regulatory factor [Desmophyllum pertusum]|uniref:Store-operated calcium entry-associated regulatory factor n=1 Tax=Desmophyllum pertusum TaxID=174260 RepID=A0A9W9YJ15_9CNID|nr:Store-operated calcium entry-associated regulatory factor [Desmophyllum pertusum]